MCIASLSLHLPVHLINVTDPGLVLLIYREPRLRIVTLEPWSSPQLRQHDHYCISFKGGSPEPQNDATL